MSTTFDVAKAEIVEAMQTQVTAALQNSNNAVAAADDALATAAGFEEQISKARANAINVLTLGAVPNVDSNQAVADSNTQIINDALLNGAAFYPAGTPVYIPPGLWVVTGLRQPSDSFLFGAGIDKTILKTITGTSANTPTLTNISNVNSSRSTLDHHLYVSDMTINGNGGNRDGTPDVNGNGAAHKLAGVRFALTERVYAYNGHSHSFDVAASTYQDNEVALTAPNKRPLGASHHVTYRDCIGGGSYDDAFTSHDSHDILYERCQAINHEAQPRTGNSNGIEVDDGSWNVIIRDCYVYGFSSGVAVKGHDPSIPARNVLIEGTTVEWCRYGYWFFWDNYAAAPALPRDVTLRKSRATNLGDVLGYDTSLGYAYHPSILISAYSNVSIEDFSMENSPTSQIAIRNGANGVIIDGVDSDGCWTEPYDPYARGVITIYDGAGAGNEVRHVRIRNWKSPVAGVTATTTESVLIEDVRIDSTDSPAWTASTVYVKGDSVAVGSSRYVAIRGGTSGTVAPVANMGASVDDGTARWTRVRSAAVEVSSFKSTIVARRIVSPGHRFLSGDRAADSFLTTQPPVVPGWWFQGEAPLRAQLTIDRTVTNSVTIVNSGLLVQLEPNSTYDFEAFLIYRSAAAADIKLGWAVPAGATMQWAAMGLNLTVGGGVGWTDRTLRGAADQVGVGGDPAVDVVANPSGQIVTGAAGGEFQLRFAQNTADATGTILRTGSRLKVTKRWT